MLIERIDRLQREYRAEMLAHQCARISRVVELCSTSSMVARETYQLANVQPSENLSGRKPV
jgi:hypothetical protein